MLYVGHFVNGQPEGEGKAQYPGGTTSPRPAPKPSFSQRDVLFGCLQGIATSVAAPPPRPSSEDDLQGIATSVAAAPPRPSSEDDLRGTPRRGRPRGTTQVQRPLEKRETRRRRPHGVRLRQHLRRHLEGRATAGRGHSEVRVGRHVPTAARESGGATYFKKDGTPTPLETVPVRPRPQVPRPLQSRPIPRKRRAPLADDGVYVRGDVARGLHQRPGGARVARRDARYAPHPCRRQTGAAARRRGPDPPPR